MIAVVEELTAVVVTVNVAVVFPAVTLTLDGTLAAALLLDRVTEAPPVGAGAFNVTVPVDDVPPLTVVGFNVTADSAAAGVIVSGAVLFTPL